MLFLLFLAFIFTLMDKPADSLDLYQQCIELDPDNEKLYYNKSAVLLNLEIYQEALDAINKAIELDSKSIKYSNIKGIFYFNFCINAHKSKIHYKLGSILLLMKNYKEALNQFNNTIKLDPKNYEAYKLKGRFLN